MSNINTLPKGFELKSNKYLYRIKNVVGQGGFGITYLASTQLSLNGADVNMTVAIKEFFLSDDCERDQTSQDVVYSRRASERITESKKDFISEARRLKNNINHSNIVKVLEVFEANNTAYYVMEYIDGFSLRKYITRNGPLNEKSALDLMMPIIFSVGYLHDHRIAHLDIKPDNIMLRSHEDEIFKPVLIDFGLSKHYDKKGKATSTIRVQAISDGYSPIEQYQGIEDFQPTADIYALISTIVYCLIGKDPKKSADIRPGEMRDLLKDKLSSRSLEAFLNGMAPSRFERTDSIRKLLNDLTPEIEINNWEIQNDKNVTQSYIFNKKNKKKFFNWFKFSSGKFDNQNYNSSSSWKYNNGTQYSKNKNERNFNSKDTTIISDSLSPFLSLPDKRIIINLKQHRAKGLSKNIFISDKYIFINIRRGSKLLDAIWIRDNKLKNKFSEKQLYGEKFQQNHKVVYADNIGLQTFSKELNKSILIENKHWEDELFPRENISGRGKVRIKFDYSKGKSFIRLNKGILNLDSNRLYNEIVKILKSNQIIKEILFDNDIDYESGYQNPYYSLPNFFTGMYDYIYDLFINNKQ